MKKKKIIMYFFIMALIIFGIMLISTNIYASTTSQIINAMDPTKNNPNIEDPTKSSNFLYLLSKVFSLIQYIGTGISIIVVLKLGITYMISSIEEKAEIKKRAVPIFIGSFIIVATVNLMKFIQELVTTSLNTPNTP